ncbi:MAG: ribonuclease HI [Chloroflexi bacterium]|nr:ribonuclease HI [Chloroflexota bacterium]
MSQDKIIIYCDGACSGNQFRGNRGGWGAVLKYKDTAKEIWGGEDNTTNQRMELTACIKALEQLKEPDIEIEIYSDSAYLVNCINQKWYEKWQKNGWKNYKKQPVENKDLWLKLFPLLNQYTVTFFKVEGHSISALNQVADSLAKKGIKEKPGSIRFTVKKAKSQETSDSAFHLPASKLSHTELNENTIKISSSANKQSPTKQPKFKQRLSGNCPICGGTGRVQRVKGPRTTKTITTICTTCVGRGNI